MNNADDDLDDDDDGNARCAGAALATEVPHVLIGTVGLMNDALALFLSPAVPSAANASGDKRRRPVV